MNRVRFAARLAVEATAAFEKDKADGVYAEEERTSYVEDWVTDGLAEAEAQLAEDRELFGHPADSPCLQSANAWGTGEGQYHGVI